MLSVVLAVTVVLLSLIWKFYNASDKNLPPRRLALPIIGNLYLIRHDRQKLFIEISKQLKSSVIRFTMWSKDIYVVNDHDPVMEVLRKQTTAFSDRDTEYLPISQPDCGIIWTTGENWTLHRNMALKSIKLNENQLEGFISEQADNLIRRLTSADGEPVNPDRPIAYTAAYIVSRILFESFNPDDVRGYVEASTQVGNLANHAGLAAMFPIVKYIPGDPFKTKLFKHYFDERRNILQRLINAERDRYKQGHLNNTFVNMYAQAMSEENPSPLLRDDRLTHSVKEVLFAAVETTKTTLMWGIYLLMKHEDVQEKMRQEIHSVIGERKVQSKDTDDIPYTMAVLAEIQRYGSVAVFTPALKCSEDTTLCGYLIPKGASILVNLASVHWDETVYSEPHQFKPGRYLNVKTDGSLEFVRQQNFVPFGAGMRICLGKSLAKLELLILFITMFQRLKFKSATDLSGAHKLNLTWHPTAFKCHITPV